MDIDFNSNSIRLFSAVSMVIFLFLSLRVIKEDIARQKIPNALIIRYLIIGVFVYTALLLYGLLQSDKFAMNYIKVALLNAAIALPFGYALWYFDLFSPGDAKYFFLSALFVPLNAYSYQFVPAFPSLLVMINAYLIAFLALFFYTIYLVFKKIPDAVKEGYFSIGYAWRGAKLALRQAVSPMFWFNLAGMLLCMVSILLIMRVANKAIQDFFHFPPGYFSVLTVLVLYLSGSRLMGFVFSNKSITWFAYLFFAGVVSFLHFVLKWDIVHSVAQTVTASFFMVVFIPIAKKLIDVCNRALESDTVENVRMTVILTEETAGIFKEKWGLEVPAGIPLTDDQSQSIKDNIPNMEKISLVKHTTFGPFIFVGAVFTIFFHHTITHYLINIHLR